MPETYPYENLDAQSFQRLAQSLLTEEFPDIECLPISGRDQGRDAVQTASDGSRLTEAVIYQVKFKEQQPLGVPTVKDLYQWLTGQLRGEVTNLNRLKERGARNYFIISNVRATAGSDNGLRAQMKTWAEENLPIPTKFWWRDDLDTRLSNNYDLIFKFALFNGPDAVRAVLEARTESRALGSSIQKSDTPAAVNAITSYLADQYRLESRLRFEQADITGSPLLELFVDVPAAITSRRTAHKRFIEWMSSIVLSSRRHSFRAALGETIELNMPTALTESNATESVGGSELFLSHDMPDSGLRIVLEGAPGQGKSTLGQYICQAHRIRLLGKKDDLQKLPSRHSSSPVRLPIRVEFRHLATWFSGINPWTSTSVAKDQESAHWATSLESFIAAHVRYSSGGLNFTADDVVAILTKTPSFIFLDGLDEVADIQLRATIVDKSQAAIDRLESLGADLQVLITSRPAVFVKAPGFAPVKFNYLSLLPLTTALISSYTQAWMRVRQIPEEHAKEIVEVLKTSISQSHVAELARNPMQLAILLWLISVKGRSLPDQRTALYEQYLTAFLDREAVKNDTVRTHRARLLEIHGFLGWVLHGRAESSDSRSVGGDISAHELQTLLHNYLVQEERPTDLVRELFEGAERVFVLVSRIEGRFEFEVQPLREFFAARYLYKTAPRSTYAQPANGTKPDRLRQLLRNPYWLNVARFFCGWYDRGELADLTRQLQDLCVDGQYKNMGYPRYLIGYILRDCTTAESQRDTRELVTAMTDPLGLRSMTARHSELRSEMGNSGSPLFLKDCGAELFVQRLREEAFNIHAHDARVNLMRAIRENDSPEERAAWWLAAREDERWDRSRWLKCGAEIGAITQIPLSNALEVFDPARTEESDWIRCVESGRFDVAFHDEDRFNLFMRALGGGGLRPIEWRHSTPNIGRMNYYSALVSLRRMIACRKRYRFDRIHPKFDSDPIIADSIRDKVEPLNAFVRIVSAGAEGSGASVFLTAMRQITAAAERAFGKSWLCWQLALIGATTARFTVNRSKGFFDTDTQLLDRARIAKLASNNLDFWKNSASVSEDSMPARMAFYAAALSWAEPSILVDILPEVGKWWPELRQDEICSLVETSTALRTLAGSGRNAPKGIQEEMLSGMRGIPASLMATLYFRTEESADRLLIGRIERSYNRNQIIEDHKSLVASVITQYKVHFATGEDSSLREVSKFYRQTTNGSFFPTFGYPRVDMGNRNVNKILSAPFSYPDGLLLLADGDATYETTSRLRPLRDMALEEKWFGELRY